MKYHDIILDLICIRKGLQKISMDLDDPNNEKIISNCIIKLSANIDAISNIISIKSATKSKKTFTIDKDELIDYLYYLEDKVDGVYSQEVNHSINKLVEIIRDYKG